MLAAGAVAAVALARGGEARLDWVGEPLLIRPDGLPDDRILGGKVRNEGLREVEIEAADVLVVDARGRRLQSSAVFLSGFAHGLWAPGGAAREGSDFERRRIGKIAQLKPGRSAPLTVSWRRTPGTGPAARIDLGDGRVLPLR